MGAYNINHKKRRVSRLHYTVYGSFPPSSDGERGADVLLSCCDENTTLITAAPLKNLGAAIRLATSLSSGKEFKIARLVAQGGFAGEGVVPREKQLAKFKGMVTCPTYNLNGDPKSALAALTYLGIGVRRFVSKNVCHRVYYDQQMHERFRAVKDKSLSLALIYQGMDAYLQRLVLTLVRKARRLKRPISRLLRH